MTEATGKGLYFIELGLDFFMNDDYPRPYQGDVVTRVEISVAKFGELTRGAEVKVIERKDGSISQLLDLLVVVPEVTQKEADAIAENIQHDLSLEEIAHVEWSMQIQAKVIAPNA